MVRGPCYYLLNIVRAQYDYPALKKAVLAQARLWEINEVIIETASAGLPLFQELRKAALDGAIPLHFQQIQGVGPRQDKLVRLSSQSAKIENGQVWLPKAAPWLEAFRQEVRQFPHGRYDDQIDSMSQFLYRFDFRQPIYEVPLPDAPEEEPTTRRRIRVPGWPRSGISFD